MAAAVAAVADEHVVLWMRGEIVQKLADFRQRRAQVSVHEQHDLARRAQHARTHRVALAALRAVVDDLNAWEGLRRLARFL